MKMKKGLLMLGVAVAAFSSCTNEEVVDMPANRAINFNGFVNNSTRAVTETDATNLTSFYVFGNYKENTWANVYTNVKVSGGKVGDNSVWTPEQIAYWQPSEKYRFAAYSNGNSSATATFDATAQKLTFTDYTPDTKDLIAAIPAELTSNANPATNEDVNLSFEHMLSQVKFTFANQDSYDYTMEISDIKVNGVKTATGTYTYNASDNLIDWTADNSKGDYDFGTLSDIAQAVGTNTHSVVCFVIPQNNEQLNVTFTATFWDGATSKEAPIAKGTFKANLAYKGNEEGTTANTWTPGFKYNYTATINGKDIDESLKDKIIEFKVDAIDGWDDATDQPTAPVVEP